MYSLDTTKEKRNDSLDLYIYFDELKEILITESPKFGAQDLVANFGGHLGLFLGFSFLSLAEFLELFILVLIVLIGRSKRYYPKTTTASRNAEDLTGQIGDQHVDIQHLINRMKVFEQENIILKQEILETIKLEFEKIKRISPEFNEDH